MTDLDISKLVATRVSACRVRTLLQPWTMAVPSADRRLPAFCVCLHNISQTDILALTVSVFYARRVIKQANTYMTPYYSHCLSAI